MSQYINRHSNILTHWLGFRKGDGLKCSFFDLKCRGVYFSLFKENDRKKTVIFNEDAAVSANRYPKTWERILMAESIGKLLEQLSANEELDKIAIQQMDKQSPSRE